MGTLNTHNYFTIEINSFKWSFFVYPFSIWIRLFTFKLHLYWASVFIFGYLCLYVRVRFVSDRKRVHSIYRIHSVLHTVKRQWPVNSWIDDNDDDNDSNDHDDDGIGEWRNLFLWYQQTKPANSKLINQIIHTHTHSLVRSQNWCFSAVAVTRVHIYLCVNIDTQRGRIWILWLFRVFFFHFHLSIQLITCYFASFFVIILILCNRHTYTHSHFDSRCRGRRRRRQLDTAHAHTNKMRKVFYDNKFSRTFAHNKNW